MYRGRLYQHDERESSIERQQGAVLHFRRGQKTMYIFGGLISPQSREVAAFDQERCQVPVGAAGRTGVDGGVQLHEARGDLRHHLAPPHRVLRERVPVGAVRLADLQPGSHAPVRRGVLRMLARARDRA